MPATEADSMGVQYIYYLCIAKSLYRTGHERKNPELISGISDC